MQSRSEGVHAYVADLPLPKLADAEVDEDIHFLNTRFIEYAVTAMVNVLSRSMTMVVLHNFEMLNMPAWALTVILVGKERVIPRLELRFASSLPSSYCARSTV